MAQNTFFKQYSVAVPLLLIVALGPLAALSIGSKVADEETRARANAGLENYQPPDLFADYEPPEVSGDSTVVDITAGSALFKTFQQSLEAAGMDEVLKGDGPFTVFAPLDSAFASLSREQRDAMLSDQDRLAKVLSRHIVTGKLGMTDLIQKEEVRTIGGEAVAIGHGSGPNLVFGDANIVKGNLAAGNGLVHVVDRARTQARHPMPGGAE